MMGSSFAAPGSILIVDDEKNIRGGLRSVLSRDGHAMLSAKNAEEALERLARHSFDVAIVDIRMPGMSGTDLLQRIRRDWPHISVILLTGHGTLDTAITAVKEGAHDYLLKPAQPDIIRQTVARGVAAAIQQREQRSLVASLRTGLQRLDSVSTDSPAPSMFALSGRDSRQIAVDKLRIDPRAHEALVDGRQANLTPSEFHLLVVLAERLGQVVDYTTLVRLSLNYQAEPWEARELIKRHVFGLRQKIESDPADPKYVLNVRGVGYRLVNPDVSRR